jgi:hypothetical protein
MLITVTILNFQWFLFKDFCFQTVLIKHIIKTEVYKKWIDGNF